MRVAIHWESHIFLWTCLNSTVVNSCDPDDCFCMKDIVGLEEVEHITLWASLGTMSDTFQRIIGIGKHEKHLHTAFEQWIDQARPSIKPTWKKLLLVLRLIDLDQLAERIESCIYATAQVSKSLEDIGRTKKRKTQSHEG